MVAPLEAADIVLFLVSADLFHSRYCREIEMPRALARHTAGEALVIPLIIRPVLWDNTLFARLQVLPAHATLASNWTNPEEAWVDIVRGIRRAVEPWRQREKFLSIITMDRVALQGMRAEDIIGLFKQAIIRRQFPVQFLSMTFEEIQAALRARVPGAQKAWKLLVDGRFDK